MVNQQTLAGNWNELKGRLRKKWGQLTNDDVQSFDGNVDRLVGLIQSKTGEARDAIESYLESITRSSANGISAAAETVQNYSASAARQARDLAGQAVSAAQNQASAAADTLQRGYRDVEKAVRKRPTESVALCLGAGILMGLLLAVTLRR